VFELTPPSVGQGRWTETVLHRFTGAKDGSFPDGLILAQSGTLYGTTYLGELIGTVFQLTPPAAGKTGWTETTLYDFRGSQDGDGALPSGGLVMDASGALYGTTEDGGGSGCLAAGCGTVFKLVP
jgi:uncharacterized repeat protein (TIGR03803 family)